MCIKRFPNKIFRQGFQYKFKGVLVDHTRLPYVYNFNPGIYDEFIYNHCVDANAGRFVITDIAPIISKRIVKNLRALLDVKTIHANTFHYVNCFMKYAINVCKIHSVIYHVIEK